MSEEAADHLEAAADDLNDARTSLNRAMEATDEEAVEQIIDRHKDVVSDLESTLKELSVNAEVMAEVTEDG